MLRNKKVKTPDTDQKSLAAEELKNHLLNRREALLLVGGSVGTLLVASCGGKGAVKKLDRAAETTTPNAIPDTTAKATTTISGNPPESTSTTQKITETTLPKKEIPFPPELVYRRGKRVGTFTIHSNSGAFKNPDGSDFSMPVVFGSRDTDFDANDPAIDDPELNNGIVLEPFYGVDQNGNEVAMPYPGGWGSAVVEAHRSHEAAGVKGPFRDITALQAGDSFTYDYTDEEGNPTGHSYTFMVTENKLYTREDIDGIYGPVEDTNVRSMTAYACAMEDGSALDEQHYTDPATGQPYGYTTHRQVVRSVLVDPETMTPVS